MTASYKQNGGQTAASVKAAVAKKTCTTQNRFIVQVYKTYLVLQQPLFLILNQTRLAVLLRLTRYWHPGLSV
jgi:hypothetical protein